MEAPPITPPATPAGAEALCAAICREALRDFAPGLVLLSPEERRRLQALGAYALTLFDFARQRGVEGERLAQINRWEFTLEAALSEVRSEGTGALPGEGGSAAAQPIFLAMAREHRRRPWPDEALDALSELARRRVSQAVARTGRERREVDGRLAGALALGVVGERPSPALARWLGSFIALRRLQDFGEELRQRRPPLAASRMPTAAVPGGEPRPEKLLDAAHAAAIALREEQGAIGAVLGELPPRWRRLARYAQLTSANLLESISRAGEELLGSEPGSAPQVGLVRRLQFLARARWLH